MKKIAFLTMASALIMIPMTAEAASGYKERNAKIIIKGQDASVKRTLEPQTLRLVNHNGGRIHIEGDVIHYVEPDGTSYYAPKGPYTTTDGLTYFSNDGIIQRVTQTEVVYVDADFRDTNRNGYTDDIDVDVERRRVR